MVNTVFHNYKSVGGVQGLGINIEASHSRPKQKRPCGERRFEVICHNADERLL